MSVVTLQRGADEYGQLRYSELQNEIERARAGVIQAVGRDAAAYYLGFHTRTLSRYNAQGVGPKSTSLSSSGGMGQSTRVFYTLADLDEWRAQLASSTYKERKIKSEVAAKKTELAVLALEVENRELHAEIARLNRLLSKKSIGFQGLHDIASPVSWIVDERGHVLGTVFDRSDDEVRDALRQSRLVYQSSLDALEMQWVDISAFVFWGACVEHALKLGQSDLRELTQARVLRHELLAQVEGT
ncbi:hypothetical protein G4Q78_19305 [Stenotrophomonas maltophilia]|nr:hypothetical protein [Stenotrophomonas maltophilia]